jgi:hypothetical protein
MRHKSVFHCCWGCHVRLDSCHCSMCCAILTLPQVRRRLVNERSPAEQLVREHKLILWWLLLCRRRCFYPQLRGLCVCGCFVLEFVCGGCRQRHVEHAVFHAAINAGYCLRSWRMVNWSCGLSVGNELFCNADAHQSCHDCAILCCFLWLYLWWCHLYCSHFNHAQSGNTGTAFAAFSGVCI